MNHQRNQRQPQNMLNGLVILGLRRQMYWFYWEERICEMVIPGQRG